MQLQKELKELEKELPDKDGPVNRIQIQRVKKRKLQNTNFEQDLLDIERKKIEFLQKKMMEDDEDINFLNLFYHTLNYCHHSLN